MEEPSIVADAWVVAVLLLLLLLLVLVGASSLLQPTKPNAENTTHSTQTTFFIGNSSFLMNEFTKLVKKKRIETIDIRYLFKKHRDIGLTEQ